MSFLKLDHAILNSTLWVDRDARDVFITALLMARPVEIREPTAQLDIRSLDHTGFTIPPGWYGIVEAAGPGLVRQAVVPREDGMAALERLGSPEPESRTSEFEGRRLCRVNGGYVVMNYFKYREKDNTAAVRQARYRLNKKARAK